MEKYLVQARIETHDGVVIHAVVKAFDSKGDALQYLNQPLRIETEYSIKNIRLVKPDDEKLFSIETGFFPG